MDTLVRLHGDGVWEEAERAQICGARPWQSMKNRWKVYLSDTADAPLADGHAGPRSYTDGSVHAFVAQDGSVEIAGEADKNTPPDDMDMDLACTQYPAELVEQSADIARHVSRAAGCIMAVAHAALHMASMGIGRCMGRAFIASVR